MMNFIPAILLTISNFGAYNVAIRQNDTFLSFSIIIMMLVSGFSHSLEFLPNFMNNPLWKMADRADALWMFVLVFAILRYMWICDVNIIYLLLDNIFRSFYTIFLFCLNKYSTMRRADGAYDTYVFWHMIWHVLIYNQIGFWCDIITNYNAIKF